jgi:fatty acid CoA ligase FadD28
MESSIPALLRERASLQPNDAALTFIDYERDWAGVAETVTWRQLYRRAERVAQELTHCASPGDRAVILAPQGFDYVAGFLGALQAGLIGVPLSVPQVGAHDERVSSVLADTSPAVILTTSSVRGNVAEHAQAQRSESASIIVAVDSLDPDSWSGSTAGRENRQRTAYLQYTSGSTRQPAGVMVSHRNLLENFKQLMSGLFADYGNVAPLDTTVVSWLPFYHDMGLILGVCGPIIGGFPAVLMNPISFLQRPARWMQLLASHSRAFSAAPNFAFELAVQRTSDEDMAGLDLGDVLGIVNGSERVQPVTLRRFTDRFACFNLPGKVLRPSYGLAEATVYVATRQPDQPPEIIHFESEKLSSGHAERCTRGSSTPLVSYGVPQSPTVRIVDRNTNIECPARKVGEIWVHGDNVATGYWRKLEETESTFGATLVAPSAATHKGPWLRTGDLGFLFDGELFIIGRIKDLLIVYGRNHSPDDIEETIHEITRGRCAVISITDESTEKLVAIVESKEPGVSREDTMDKLAILKDEVTSAIASSHGLGVADLVLVSAGSIPITTSGKIRRAACVERYRSGQFVRIDL